MFNFILILVFTLGCDNEKNIIYCFNYFSNYLIYVRAIYHPLNIMILDLILDAISGAESLRGQCT
jgi:hypothetical protein